jgi:hypothetical protein
VLNNVQRQLPEKSGNGTSQREESEKLEPLSATMMNFWDNQGNPWNLSRTDCILCRILSKIVRFGLFCIQTYVQTIAPSLRHFPQYNDASKSI